MYNDIVNLAPSILATEFAGLGELGDIEEVAAANDTAASRHQPVSERNPTVNQSVVEKTMMQIGMIGLGRMGANIVRRLLHPDRQCVVYNRSPKAVKILAKEGAGGASSRADLVKKVEKPRAVWMTAPPNRAICTAGRAAPVTSSRWCITASSMASWRPMPREWTSWATPMRARANRPPDPNVEGLA